MGNEPIDRHIIDQRRKTKDKRHQGWAVVSGFSQTGRLDELTLQNLRPSKIERVAENATRGSTISDLACVALGIGRALTDDVRSGRGGPIKRE